jgi:hypothetical protein
VGSAHVAGTCLAIFDGPALLRVRIVFVLQWAKSTSGNKGQLVYNIKYLDIPLRKSHINTSANIHYLLCCDESH